MFGTRAMWRMVSIGATLARYRLDELLELLPGLRLLRWLRALLPSPRGDIGSLSRGARLRLCLQSLGPLFVKFGQMLSMRPDALPEPLILELRKLQDAVTPVPFAEIEPVLTAGLPDAIDEVFSELEREPIASASLAQVYRARLRATGERVAVKVQRQGIRKTIEADG